MPEAQMTRLERAVLGAPSLLAWPLSLLVRDPERRWMLSQPRRVRVSYLREIVDGPPVPRLVEFWMLRQPHEVRQAYIRRVLNHGDGRGGAG